ncbi:MAG TPA: ATP-binding protein [Solirubrobacteraceae bacterium]|nr:ATP-binding protein [Solirubrobacteraceae bacterium]
MSTDDGSSVNPFRFGALALDRAFTDRESEIDELVADVRNGQDLVIFAPRRYGKSSLIWRVAQQLVTEDVLVAQVDLMRTPTKEKLAEKLAQTIHEEVASRLFRARERLRVFAGLRIKPTVTVDPDDGSLSFGFDARADKQDIDATLEGLLALPGRLAAERDRRVAIVLDDFQEVVDIDPGLPRLMRSVFQEQPEVAHVYLGSKRHMMQRIFNDENEPFWRSAKQFELGVIPRVLFERFAGQRFEQTGRMLAAQAAAAVLELTGGHPYATQEAFYFLWEQTPPGETADITRLEQALEALLRSEHAHFSLLWERSAAAQRRVLQALASEQPGRPLSSDFQRRHSLPVTATVQTALDALSNAELLSKVGRGEYRIAEPFLAEWIAVNES